MEVDQQAPGSQGQPTPTPAIATTAPPAAAVLDLNPTAFVDDLSNSVELHCATAFDELDSALRTALQADLTPEQLTVLFQGTAGLYQDLRMELKRQMQAFEEYALEEILKVPVGLLPDAPGAEGGAGAAPEASPEEEAAVEARLKELRAAIAGSKRRARDMQTAGAALDRAMAGARDRLARLEAVPGALAGKENVTGEARALAERGAAVEAGCAALGVRLQGEAGGSAWAAPPEGEAGATAMEAVPPEEMTDAAVEREILRRQGAVKSAPAEDLRAVRDNLGLT